MSARILSFERSDEVVSRPARDHAVYRLAAADFLLTDIAI